MAEGMSPHGKLPVRIFGKRIFPLPLLNLRDQTAANIASSRLRLLNICVEPPKRPRSSKRKSIEESRIYTGKLLAAPSFLDASRFAAVFHCLLYLGRTVYRLAKRDWVRAE